MNSPIEASEARDRLRRALTEIGLLGEVDSLPEPYDQTSGVANRSLVWFLHIPRGRGTGQSIVAKFDDPERAKSEWRAIGELRKLNTPPSAMLPLPKNEERHGLILYQNAAAHVLRGKIVTFLELLRQQLSGNRANCLAAIEEAFRTLRFFYAGEPGAMHFSVDSQVLRWRDAFPTILERLESIRTSARLAWDDVNWDAPMIAPADLDGQFRNPLYEIAERCKAPTGRVMLSRVHGDLNLTNILVGLDSRHVPDGVFIIDLANSRTDAPTAIDLGRLESEFWHEALIEPTLGMSDKAFLNQFLATRHSIDSGATCPVHLEPIMANAALFVDAIRREALRELGGNQPHYVLDDYMLALYFSHVQALSFPSIQKSSRKCRLAVLAASITLSFINKLERGTVQWAPILSDQPQSQFSRLNKSKRPVSPSPTGLLLGRSESLNAACALLSGLTRPHHVTVTGLPGSGKTQFALTLAAQVRDAFPDGQIYVSLLGAGRTDQRATAAIASCLQQLGVQTGFTRRTTGSLQSSYRKALAARKVLIVADDLVSTEEFESLIPPPPSALLATSSLLLSSSNTSTIQLPGLSLSDGATLLQSIVPSCTQHEALTLSALVGGLPLALTAIGQLLSTTPHLTAAGVAEHLTDPRNRLRYLAQPGLAPILRNFKNLYRQLPHAFRALLRNLTVFSDDFSASSEAAICLDHNSVTLGALIRLGLVVPTGNTTERYRIHPLVLSIAKPGIRISTSLNERFAFHFRELLGICESLYLVHPDKGVARFQADYHNLVLAYSWARSHMQRSRSALEVCATLPDVGWHLLRLRLPPVEQVAWLTGAIAAAERLKRPALVAALVATLASAYHGIGDHAAAFSEYRRAFRLFDGSPDRIAVARLELNFANFLCDRDEYKMSRAYASQALAQAQEAAVQALTDIERRNAKRTEVLALLSLSRLSHRTKAALEARSYCDRAFTGARELRDQTLLDLCHRVTHELSSAIVSLDPQLGDY